MPNHPPEPRPSIRRRARLGETLDETPPLQEAPAEAVTTRAAPAVESVDGGRVLIAHRVPSALKRRLALAKLMTGQDQERIVTEAITHHLDQLGVPTDLPASAQAS